MSAAEIEQNIWDIEEGIEKLIGEKQNLDDTKSSIKKRIEIVKGEMETLRIMLNHGEDKAGIWQQHSDEMDGQLQEAKDCAEDARQNAGAQTGYLKEQAKTLKEYAKKKEEQVAGLWNEMEEYKEDLTKLWDGTHEWQEEVEAVTGTWAKK